MEDWSEYDYRKTQQLDDLKKCLRIANNYRVWTNSYEDMTLEIATLYYENGIACECDADDKKVFYLKEVV